MAASLNCRVLAVSAFCRLTTQTPSITNCLVAIVHTKPVIAILVAKLVAKAMSLSVAKFHENQPRDVKKSVDEEKEQNNMTKT